jgi:hypothetical protein
MKLSSLLLAIPLAVMTITPAFAKENTLQKSYGQPAPTAAVQSAKSAYQGKRLVLSHPQKMSLLGQKYAAMQKACHKTGGRLVTKNGFVAKAQRHEVAKHNCPYQHGMRGASEATADAKAIHTQKSHRMQGHGQQQGCSANCCASTACSH